MLELAFSAEDLARMRFAISPVWEVVASVRVLGAPGAHALHLPWIKRVRARLARDGPDLTPLTELVGHTGHLPGFLAATPESPLPELAQELAVLRRVEPATVRAGLDELPATGTAEVRRMYRDPAGGLDRLADRIAAYWEVAIGPDWPRIRALCEGDVLYRSRLLADGGAERLFHDLAPAVRWSEGRLSVRHRHLADTRALDGRGLVLVPSVFSWPRVFSKVDPRWQPVLRYPPRGIATLWERGGTETAGALAAVLGRGRATLLTELAAPSSTTELARRTGLSAGGVSQHLGALRAAGLVSAQRTGRVVLYARTLAADGLLRAAGEVDC
ncbi:ArsR/SmtB family transcription factor [Amycolatopsis cihanbeyliensis]|uniref:Helix-turn-helix protein n=1 Tax=Amycolatopsis cihanbeyliensis TaxID=1128664 RepID=A0A542DDX9_AMYCI|nr:DUF5937 family protein [Amycolatopsis cihanbeyliensis]TQJ01273.1 helix-turn-helix protein [Amycolatopsis cihanbeyliensis]